MQKSYLCLFLILIWIKCLSAKQEQNFQIYYANSSVWAPYPFDYEIGHDEMSLKFKLIDRCENLQASLSKLTSRIPPVGRVAPDIACDAATRGERITETITTTTY